MSRLGNTASGILRAPPPPGRGPALFGLESVASAASPLLLKKPASPALEEFLRRIGEAREEAKNPNNEQHVMCRECLHGITSADQRMEMLGSHLHTFQNPQGLVFDIGLFRDAWGCAQAGPPTVEFTWFPGHAWRVALCGRCLAHLGWRYQTASGASFYGLIISRLVLPDENG
jgi:hypothetical protein